jgi:hypothetical protein
MKAKLSVLLIVFSMSRVQAQDDTEIILSNRKSFVDFPGGVSVTGTLTGDGVLYKNNTYSISCNKDRMECWVSNINQIGPKQMGMLLPPDVLAVTKWDANEVIADNARDCPRIIITLDRKTKTATWLQGAPSAHSDFFNEPCPYPDKQIHKWTIEEPLWARK